MRVIDCPCGHRFEADEELARLYCEHVSRDQPEVRARVAADARDA